MPVKPYGIIFSPNGQGASLFFLLYPEIKNNPILVPGYFTEIFRLFFPERCAACGNVLPEGSYLLCPHCRWDMPLTGYCGVHDNPVYRKFGGLLPVAEASSWLFFVSHSHYRDMIHSFKYRGQWGISRKLGSLMGDALHEGGLYDSVDAVVPVPLHSLRRLRRGYNQAEYLAEGIACGLGKPLCTGNVVRSRHNRSQASTRVRDERWDNVKNIFSIRHPEALDGRHILLVDDVLTTGATLISCAEAILHSCPSCRISVSTLAVSAHELFGRHSGGGL